MMQSAMNYEYKGCILICLKNFELDPAVRKQKIRELKEKVQTELGQFGYYGEKLLNCNLLPYPNFYIEIDG